MERFTYLPDVTTLSLDSSRCNGCRMCTKVCPHGVFGLEGGKAMIMRRDACMECGACARNCEQGALAVEAGVGCAAAFIATALGIQGACCSAPLDPVGSGASCSTQPSGDEDPAPC